MDDYACTREQLEEFLEENKDAIEVARNEHFPGLVDDPLWIGNKNERLKRAQDIAEKLYDSLTLDGLDAVTLREFRAYLMYAANELGQLLNRGSGDTASGETLSVEFTGIDTEMLK